jgi:hypothetical protein
VTFLFNQIGPAGASAPVAPRALVGTKNDPSSERTILMDVVKAVSILYSHRRASGGVVCETSLDAIVSLANSYHP